MPRPIVPGIAPLLDVNEDDGSDRVESKKLPAPDLPARSPASSAAVAPDPAPKTPTPADGLLEAASRWADATAAGRYRSTMSFMLEPLAPAAYWALTTPDILPNTESSRLAGSFPLLTRPLRKARRSLSDCHLAWGEFSQLFMARLDSACRRRCRTRSRYRRTSGRAGSEDPG